MKLFVGDFMLEWRICCEIAMRVHWIYLVTADTGTDNSNVQVSESVEV